MMRAFIKCLMAIVVSLISAKIQVNFFYKSTGQAGLTFEIAEPVTTRSTANESENCASTH